jgi:hypothetical protein
MGCYHPISACCRLLEICCSPNFYNVKLVRTSCLMHMRVCIWRYILQNYNYKLHFQNLFIYHILHVFIETLAIENLDVCTVCDLWDSNIQLTMVKDRRWQIYPNVVQCLILTLGAKEFKRDFKCGLLYAGLLLSWSACFRLSPPSFVPF